MSTDNKVASIVPIAHFDLVKTDRYHMALSHLMGEVGALATPAQAVYREFFERQVARGSYVIMDNGVVETGRPESFESYIDKAIRLKVSEVVVPDFPASAMKSAHMMKTFFDFLAQTSYRGNVMAVPHGDTWTEWRTCLDIMLQYPVQTIGISRLDYDRGTLTSRPRAVEEVLEAAERKGRSISVHLLGCTNAPTMTGVGDVLRWPEVRGIDSSIAALWTKHGQVLAQLAVRPKDWEPINIEQDTLPLRLLELNLQTWKDLCADYTLVKGGRT